MKYFVLLTGLILACYLLGFIKKPEKYQWMDRNYTTAIKGFSILTVVWAHSGAMLSVGGLQFIAGMGKLKFQLLLQRWDCFHREHCKLRVQRRKYL